MTKQDWWSWLMVPSVILFLVSAILSVITWGRAFYFAASANLLFAGIWAAIAAISMIIAIAAMMITIAKIIIEY